MKNKKTKISKISYIFIAVFLLLLGVSYAQFSWNEGTPNLAEYDVFEIENVQELIDAVEFLYTYLVFSGNELWFNEIDEVKIIDTDGNSKTLAEYDYLTNEFTQLKQVECHWVPSDSDWVNSFDLGLGIDCGDGFLTGISSVHSNSYEDRRYRFMCCYFPGVGNKKAYYCDGGNNLPCSSRDPSTWSSKSW